ncbi:uncharacterized protein LOC141651037 [Silene latifolia]|uniref:uncharacterized protein LOC141651037 n=1 Tax=Silene latifolia TaxID=37657 RepID=UPI003D77FA46
MAKESVQKSSSNNHSNKKSVTANALRSEKLKKIQGPNVEEGQKERLIHDITGIPTLPLNERMVEDIDEEMGSGDEEDPDGAWFQRHRRKFLQVIEDEPEDLLQLTVEDVQGELDYWKQALYGFIVGANPPWQVLEGFLKRIWSKYTVDKISFLPNGVFLARFNTEEMKQADLGSGHFLFDNKPMIIKPWIPDIELTKEEVKSVPAWIRLHNLPLKFWGKSLAKLANLVGTYVKSDTATDQKTRLGFARVMVELKLGQSFPNSIKFMDEKQNLIEINVEYEWKPSVCLQCKQIGHEKEKCRNNKPGQHAKPIQKVWKPIQKKVIVAREPIPSTQPAITLENTIVSMSKVQQQETKESSEITPVQKINLATYRVTHLQMFITFVYAFNGVGEREELWNNLRRLAGQIQIPWSVGGDFNCVTMANERLGGNVTDAEAIPFQQCIDDCNLSDMKATCAFYTWNNKQPLETRIYSRLDRVFVNHEWTVNLPDYYANFLPEGHFDHTPCVISKTKGGQGTNRPFKYFNMWSSAPDFQSCVSTQWNRSIAGTKMYGVVRKLKMLKPILKNINRSHFSDVESKSDIAQTLLYQLQKQLVLQPGDENLIKQEHEAHKNFIHLQSARLAFLKQKAKAHWMKEGDSNTSYFHGMIKSRRSKNYIQQITDHKLNLYTEEEGIQKAFLDYYQMLLGSKASTTEVKGFIVQRGSTCTEIHKQQLLRPITHEEIKQVMFNIPNDKAPGPDGYSSKFFKDTWETVGEDISNAILDFFDSDQLLKQINNTLITLIPKVERPSSVLQYRPIACCNVVYKCISKILCNMLAIVLPDLVSQNQGGFIHGRSIMENILICQDIIRLYEKRAVSSRCLFKMDLQKAYDTIEWEFLNQMLIALKFPDQFRKWIMECVTTPSNSLNLNGNVFGFFKGQRGLRQGDPLSPLLFTVCMEYLTRLLDYTTDTKDFRFHPLCKPMRLTHLMFARRFTPFRKGDAHSMMTILENFLHVFRFFEPKYEQRTFYKCLASNRQGGRENTLSRGKETILSLEDWFLFESVLKTLHNSRARMFILPSFGVIVRIEAICRNFLWDGGPDYMKSPLVSWEKACKPKNEGGLGLKNDLIWNKAAIGKLVWWIASKSDILWVKWVNHTYIKGADWQSYSPTNNSSWYWRKICQIKMLLQDSYQQQLWNNNQIYTIAKGYELLRDKGEKIKWKTLIWNKWTIPKHGFMAWIYQHGNMNINDKLFKLGISEPRDHHAFWTLDRNHHPKLESSSMAIEV